MIIKNNKCGKIFTKSKYIFLQRRERRLGVGADDDDDDDARSRESRKWWERAGVLVAPYEWRCASVGVGEGKALDVHKVRMYTPDRYENIKVETRERRKHKKNMI